MAEFWRGNWKHGATALRPSCLPLSNLVRDDLRPEKVARDGDIITFHQRIIFLECFSAISQLEQFRSFGDYAVKEGAEG